MEMHPERLERIADKFSNEYEKYLYSQGIRDDPRFRKIWSAAFTFGYQAGTGWIPADQPPRANGFYLVTTELEHSRAGKTRVGFYRDRKWLWFVEDGVLDVFGVLAWQPLPEPYQELSISTNLAKVKPSFGLGLTLKKLAKFLTGVRSLDAAFNDGRKMRMNSNGNRWRFEWEDRSYETSSLLLGFRWLLARKGRRRRKSNGSGED